MIPVVVVPDGLAAEAGGYPKPSPSFVFQAVLDRAAERYRDHPIWIAPANTFGGPVAEQEVGSEYLKAKGCSNALAPSAAEVSAPGYIDTMGNATELRSWLVARKSWPLGPCILLVARLHAKRARLCFEATGFEISAVETVGYTSSPELIVPRLGYYKHPRLHAAYEILARQRDRIRIAFRRGKI